MRGLSRTPFCAALIAGGKSTRMGHDKRLIDFDGRPLWKQQLDTLTSLQPDELVISGEVAGPWKDSGHTIVPDTATDAGPLAGIAAILATVRSPLLLVLAVDMPHMTADFLRRLLAQCTPARGVVPSHPDLFEPLAAIYPRDCATLVNNCLLTSNFSLQNFVQGCTRGGLLQAVEIAKDDAHLFHNLNTPEDLSKSRF